MLICLWGSASAQVNTAGNSVPPPRPLLPIPTARQLDWQRDELRLFLHFGVNTFTDREWGTGDEDPGVFNPTRLDARQWARVAKESGFRTLILTAKHHDGFTLWPSRYTDHSVERSPWKDGKGDVVRDLVEAVRVEGLKVGLYLSPWDRHEPCYGDEAAYNAFYLGQLRELLTDYGPLAEVWFDGAKGKDAKDMVYDFDAYWALVRQLQPGAVIFSDAGPDVRWIGNEHGFAGSTNWSTYDRTKVGVGIGGMNDYLNTGEAGAPDWVPGECDVSIRPGWFWHADQEPKTVNELIEIYFKSVGRGSVLLLNVPPNTEGLIADADAERLREFKAAVDRIFASNLVSSASANASSIRGRSNLYSAARVLDGSMETYWAVDEGVTSALLELNLGTEKTFNVVMIREPIQLGQRVSAYRFEKWQDGSWEPIIKGTTIGYKRLERLESATTTRRVRLTIQQALAEPLIAEVGLYYDE
jgi:alpha-L-fucosidase